ncbi:Zn(2+)-responsive transcriptional regulator [Dongshaea marina]|uniref:Zn(2+)-responsive transcriptional regulator n=1 Tax=Dongshaea marina TaxID=2047966 RepID=UPI002D7A33F9|nr:Zn(2+)-responsive transcriptional regulator [Dongshaea marina]
MLTPSARSESGYRLYTREDHARLQFILRCKQVGFSLADIHELLSIRVDKSHKTCMDVKDIADGKIREIQEKIKVLEQFQRSLVALSSACCGGPESAEHCSIMESLEVFACEESGSSVPSCSDPEDSVES